MKRWFGIFCAIVLFQTIIFAQNNERIILIKTELGNIRVKLYNQTPKHRDNILKLIDEKFYDGILFHRVIDMFMIQAGDPDSKNAEPGKMLGEGGPGYLIDAEIVPELIHKKGVLAAARQGDNVNPEKKSSGSQFYIVEGQVLTNEMLDKYELKIKYDKKTQVFFNYLDQPENKALKYEYDSLKRYKYIHPLKVLTDNIATKLKVQYEEIDNMQIITPQQREIYTTIGGTPHLDGGYTIFGEVIEGMDIVDKISGVEIDQYSRPLQDIRIITIEIEK